MPVSDPAASSATSGAADHNDDLGTAPREREQYTTFVAEREIAAPRSVAFAAVCDLITEATGGPVALGDPEPHGLGARFERRGVGGARGADFVDGAKRAAAQAVGPGVDNLVAQGSIADLVQLGQGADDRLAQFVR